MREKNELPSGLRARIALWENKSGDAPPTDNNNTPSKPAAKNSLPPSYAPPPPPSSGGDNINVTRQHKLSTISTTTTSTSTSKKTRTETTKQNNNHINRTVDTKASNQKSQNGNGRDYNRNGGSKENKNGSVADYSTDKLTSLVESSAPSVDTTDYSKSSDLMTRSVARDYSEGECLWDYQVRRRR